MRKGVLHPVSQIIRVAVSALGDLGFDIVDDPEVDTPWYNFDGLRMGQNHPARQGHDTFWLDDHRLLRTHTTNMQLHVSERRKPPYRVITFGPCYRNDATDATHDIRFTHLDGLAIEEDISLSNLLSILDTFIRRIFDNTTRYRFRLHNFPFTEPSLEVDVWHNERWIELLGAGMVHPEVIVNMGLDPKTWRGLAFGIGLERVSMIKWGIEDIRLLHANRVPFLGQFRGRP